MGQNGQILKIFGQHYLKFIIIRGHFYSFFGPRYWAYRATAEEKKFGTHFFAQADLKKLGPNPMTGC